MLAALPFSILMGLYPVTHLTGQGQVALKWEGITAVPAWQGVCGDYMVLTYQVC